MHKHTIVVQFFSSLFDSKNKTYFITNSNQLKIFSLVCCLLLLLLLFLVIHKRTSVRRVRGVYDLPDLYQANENAQWF